MYERFAQLLKETGRTAADVSKATGIDPSTFSYWKSGRSTPKYQTLRYDSPEGFRSCIHSQYPLAC